MGQCFLVQVKLRKSSYAHTPNLELTENDDDCEIVDQKPDHFRLRSRKAFGSDVEWKARGIRVSPVAAPVPPPWPAPSPPADLPAEPVRVP